ncbi:hypothetical protein C4D60_Mb08t11270 [Musa balbisiana]|uniref:LysM domain-containing protein n=1 Tax=Musa balbisiana TaxID=52838 RepID=A0A4S8K300_MUSBA|nr:hypothetical protein C4D60_Mb08t11270 [Musa balbisiana]
MFDMASCPEMLGLSADIFPRIMDQLPARGGRLRELACDETYVVAEGETLHAISDKCGDPFIVERNPHIHDPDDVLPGLVIKLAPSKPR